MMTITTITNDVANENTYLVENDTRVLVIDPGSDTKGILKKIKKLEKPVQAILLTHTHYDHIMSLEAVREAFNQPDVYVSALEASWLFNPKDNLSGHIRHADIPDVICKPAEQLLQYQKPYTIGDFHFQVVETPGHSIGGVSFIFHDEETIFSGDALFKGSIGRYDLPTGNYDQLIKGIEDKLFSQPEQYKVYPGHGQMTSIGQEKHYNPFF